MPTAFSSALAGPMGQSLVAQLQDDDLTLHRQFLDFLQRRVEAERCYAQQLQKIATHFRPKGSQHSIAVSDTQVHKAWLALVHSTELFSQAILSDSGHLQTRVKYLLERTLSEKTELRRAFQQRKQLHEETLQKMDASEAKLKGKLLKAVKKATEERGRFLSVTQRANCSEKAAGSARASYCGSLQRVHNAHNGYVLSLEEANAHCQLYEANSLPRWLDLQQEMMQLQVEQSKIVLHELCVRLTHANEHFKQIASAALAEVNAIEPESEFDSFLESNKSPCVASCLKEYDDSLLLQYQGNSLHEHRLILNELTTESLEKSKKRYEAEKIKAAALLETKTREAKKELEGIRIVRDRLDDSNEGQAEDLRRRKSRHIQLSQEEVETQCRLDMYSKLAALVSRAIDDGRAAHSGALPPVAELQASAALSGGSSIVSLPTAAAASTSNVSASGGLLSRFRHSLPHANRNSTLRRQNGSTGDAANPPPLPPPPPPLPSSPVKAVGRAAEVSAEAGAAAVVPGSPLPAARKTRKSSAADGPPRPPIRERYATAPTEGEEAELPERRKKDSRHGAFDATAAAGDRLSNHVVSPVAAHRRELEKESYFHGILPRDEVQRLLKEDGDFLIRESHNRRPRNGNEPLEKPWVLSVYWQGYKHFIVQGQPGSWHFEGSGFATIPELIDHHLVTGDRITVSSGAVISNPVPRSDWQLDNDDIQLGVNIGRGNFGDVHVGFYNGMKVAVKTCREEVSEEMRRRFLDEGKILLKYTHRNVVRLIGIAAQRQPIMIVMEYVANGSLLNYLKRQRDLARSSRLKICLDASNGMAYLESKNCIHRDLAARNCLVGEDHIVKIADFGMSREEEVYTVSEGMKQIPIKWTAPEALSTGHYTGKCDVWSYGVLMWEVYAKGATPYMGLTNTQTREKVEAGYRMPAPEGTPSEVYDVMLRCWEPRPQERPTFVEIVAYLTRLHNDEMEGPETSLL